MLLFLFCGILYIGLHINISAVDLTQEIYLGEKNQTIININSPYMDSIFLTNLRYEEYFLGNTHQSSHSLYLHSHEEFLGDIQFLTQKTGDKNNSIYLKDFPDFMTFQKLDAIRSNNNQNSLIRNFPPDYSDNQFIGTTQTLSGSTLTDKTKSLIFNQKTPNIEFLNHVSGIAINQHNINTGASPKQISWNIEKLGVFLSNRSQSTTITIIHPDKPTHLHVEYISKMDSFEGKTEIISCPKEQDSCSFSAPVDILKKSKEILVTIEK